MVALSSTATVNSCPDPTCSSVDVTPAVGRVDPAIQSGEPIAWLSISIDMWRNRFERPSSSPPYLSPSLVTPGPVD